MGNELQFCVKNLTTGETLAEFSKAPEFDENGGMWIQQVYTFGDVIEGVQFTCQVLPDRGYCILIHSNFSKVGETEYAIDSPLKLQYDYKDGNSYFFSVRRKPQKRTSLFKRLFK